MGVVDVVVGMVVVAIAVVLSRSVVVTSCWVISSASLFSPPIEGRLKIAINNPSPTITGMAILLKCRIYSQSARQYLLLPLLVRGVDIHTQYHH